MESERFRLYMLIISLITGFIIGFSAMMGNFLIPLISVFIAMILLYLLKTGVKEVIDDERIYLISEKASRRAIQVVSSFTAIPGLILILLSGNGYPEFKEIGYTLAFFGTVLLFVYLAFYLYYSKKFGE